ncbi:MAG TPA: hypothetical protein VFX49_02270 [Chloroflexota bacterium]|nr:hypothetical protein [Chloroflexota bacterium]
MAISTEAELAGAPEQIEGCFAACDLRVALKGTARAHPGSIHWHLKRGRERGTLEVTLWPSQRRLWLSVHDNRGAPWIDEMLPDLKEALAALNGGGGGPG